MRRGTDWSDDPAFGPLWRQDPERIILMNNVQDLVRSGHDWDTAVRLAHEIPSQTEVPYVIATMVPDMSEEWRESTQWQNGRLPIVREVSIPTAAATPIAD